MKTSVSLATHIKCDATPFRTWRMLCLTTQITAAATARVTIQHNVTNIQMPIDDVKRDARTEEGAKRRMEESLGAQDEIDG